MRHILNISFLSISATSANLAISAISPCPPYWVAVLHNIQSMSNILQLLANWELFFQRFDSIQLPSSGNIDKQSTQALITMVVTLDDVMASVWVV